MALTKRVDAAAPYVNRLLDDRDLQRDLREAMSSLRRGYGRAEAKRRKPSRLLGDRKLKQNVQKAVASLKDAAARFRGEAPKSHRGRRVVLGLIVVAGVAFAAKEMLKEQEPSAPAGSP